MGASGSVKQKPSIGARQYLFTADVNVDKFRTSGEIEIPPNSFIEVIPDMLLYAERAGVNNGELLPYRSNEFGYLVFDKAQYQTTQPVHLLKKQSFIVPPMDMLNLSWSLNSLSRKLDPKVEKESWHTAIIDYIKTSGFDKEKNSIELDMRTIPFAKMRKPEAVPTGEKPDLDKYYREWYAKAAKDATKGIDKLHGYFIPRVRMVFCVFNNPLLKDAKVEIFNSDDVPVGDSVTVDAGDGAVIAVIAANKSQLPANATYKIEVVLEEPLKGFSGLDKEKWNSSFISAEKYQFQEILTFNMGSRLGEYDVIMCDPITVEETLLQQFPKEYEHLARFIKGSNPPQNQVVHQYRGRQQQDLLSEKGIKTLAGQIQLANGKAAMVSGVLASDSKCKFTEKLGRAIYAHADQAVPENGRKLLNLAFQTADVARSWKDFPKSIGKRVATKVEKIYEVKIGGSLADSAETMSDFLKKIDGADTLTEFEFNLHQRLSRSKDGFLGIFGKNSFEYVDKKSPFKQRKLFLDKVNKHAVDKYKIKDMPPVLGKRAKQSVEMINKITDPVGKWMAGYAVAEGWYDVLSKKGVLKQSNNQYRAMLLDYSKSSCNKFKHHDAAAIMDKTINTSGIDMATVIPSREGMMNLEKMRSSTVMVGRDVDKAAFDAAMASFDFILAAGTASGFPPLAIGCEIVALIKETGILIYSAVDFAIDYFMDKDHKSKIAVLNELRENSLENQELMPKSDEALIENGIKDLDIQFRMRAEAFYGLAGLITRASSTASESQAKKIQNYLNKIAKIDQEEKELGDPPDKDHLNKIVDERNTVINELADFRNEILKAKVEKYRIKEYIQEFILKDGWVLPVKDLCGTPLDILHLYNSGKNGFTRENGDANYLEAEAGERHRHVFNGAMAKLFYVGGAVGELFKHEIRSNFSQAFPVHNFSADSVLDLVKTFRMVQPEILRFDPVQYTCIFHRNQDMTDSKAKAYSLPDHGWFLVNDDEMSHITSLDYISALSQIRIFVLLKNDPIFAENHYPFELQLSRVDGWNIDGPLYKGMVHALDPKQLLSHELRMSGLDKNPGQKRYGIVFTPTFQFGAQNLLGTKPMSYNSAISFFNSFISEGKNAAGNNFSETHQPVCWNLQIGNTNDFRNPIKLGRPSDVDNSLVDANGKVRETLNNKNELDEYKIFIDKNNDLEKQLLNSKFLLSRGQEWEMPKVLGSEDYVFGIMLKLDDNPFVFVAESHKDELENIKATNIYNKKPIKLGLVKKKRIRGLHDGDLGLVIENYDWKTPIEFMVLIRAGKHVEENGKYVSEVPKTSKTNLNWKNCIKLGFDTVHRTAWKNKGAHKEVGGPGFSSTLYYLGKRDDIGQFTAGQFDSKKQGIAPDPKVEDAFDFIQDVIKTEKTDVMKYAHLIRKLKTKGINSQSMPFFENEFHFFAAHVKPSYTINDEDWTRVDSLRPFAAYKHIPVKGKFPSGAMEGYSEDFFQRLINDMNFEVVAGDLQLTDKFPFGYYEYGFENFVTSDGTKEESSQFNQSILENCFDGGRFPLKIMIEAPESNYKDVPWQGLVKKDDDQKAVDAWITNNTKSVGIPHSVQKTVKKQAANNANPPVQPTQNSGSTANKSTKSTTKPKGKKP